MTEDSQLELDSPNKKKKINEDTQEFPTEQMRKTMLFAKEMSASKIPGNINTSPNTLTNTYHDELNNANTVPGTPSDYNTEKFNTF